MEFIARSGHGCHDADGGQPQVMGARGSGGMTILVLVCHRRDGDCGIRQVALYLRLNRGWQSSGKGQ